MTRRERQGPSGSMTLSSYWEESSSTHLEIEEKVTLEEKNGIIYLKENKIKTNFIKPSASSKSEITYQITAEKLIKIIKENGLKV